MRLPCLVVLLALSISLAGCTLWSEPAEEDGKATDITTAATEPTDPPDARSEQVTEHVLTQAVPVPGGGGDLLLVERGGGVLLLGAGADEPEPLLDLSGRVDSSPARERGLKGAAFHPDFEENGMLLFVYDDTVDADESRAGHGQVMRYFADPEDLSAGLEEGELVIEVEFPGNWFHNMAGLKFGPDGMLYVGLGDGGSYRMHAQDTSNLWGSILRLDVDGGEGYDIPDDNPFVGDPDQMDEIWLYGLRNPWRFDFHPDTGDLFIANAGESDVESVYLYPSDGNAPRNHGWPHMEGNQTFEPDDGDDYGEPPDEMNLPIVTYLLSESNHCVMTGGVVYQGDHFPDLQGKFVFADHCSGQLMFAELVQDEWVLTEWFPIAEGWVGITSVDVDHEGELLVSSLNGLFRVVP